MTAPISDPDNAVLQPYINKINELQDLNARLMTELSNAQTLNADMRTRWDRATNRVARFFTTIFNQEEEALDSAVIEASNIEPERKYNFKYRVTGYVWQEATGTNVDDAWDNIDIHFDSYDVEDLEYDNSGYEDHEDLGMEDVTVTQAASFLRS